MRKKRKFCGAPPKGEQWSPSKEFFSCDGSDWTIYYSLRCVEDGYVNFKIFSLGLVQSKANYWIGMSHARTFNTDGALLELRPELYEWAHKVMRGIYSKNIGQRGIAEVAA